MRGRGKVELIALGVLALIFWSMSGSSTGEVEDLKEREMDLKALAEEKKVIRRVVK